MVNDSLVGRVSSFLFEPYQLAGKYLGSAYYHTTGKMAVGHGLSASALYLSQTIASVVAIPILILSGIFSCLYQFSKGEYNEGINEFANGFINSGKHATAILLTPFASIGIALLVIIGLPHYLYTWNTYNKWWEPSKRFN